jgi:hypothetical protein
METKKRSIIKIPAYTLIEFSRYENNLYQKSREDFDIDACNRVPNILRLEQSRKPGIRKNVNHVITDLNKTGKHLFFTGLKPVPKKDLHFIGDHLQFVNSIKVVSLVYFVFKPNFSGFTLFYFTDYTKPPKLQQSFFRVFRNYLKELNILDT